jgi:hypothetical protein
MSLGGDGATALAHAIAPGDPEVLSPIGPRLLLDADYALGATGLLRDVDPSLAMKLAVGSLADV